MGLPPPGAGSTEGELLIKADQRAPNEAVGSAADQRRALDAQAHLAEAHLVFLQRRGSARDVADSGTALRLP